MIRNKDIVRNPVLALPESRELAELLNQHPEVKAAFVRLLKAIRRQQLAAAEYSWEKHKAPMACYHKAVGVLAGHIARALR